MAANDTPDRPLAAAMRQLAFGFKLQTGQEATHILLPRKSLRSEVIPFVEALCREEPAIGKPHVAFDRMVSTPDGEPIAEFCGLTMMMYDGRDVVVGRADGLDMPNVEVVG